MKRAFLLILLLSAVLLGNGCISGSGAGQQVQRWSSLQDGFVYLDTVAPGVALDMRYCSKNNFMGLVVDGYEAPKCIMTRETAEAVRNVQDELNRFSMSLKIFDAYRPQRSVDHFVRWSKDLPDARMKNAYYPDVAKENLFKEGYIWTKSGHSRGSTVDLTIVVLPEGKELDMGSGFDFFGDISHTKYRKITLQQKANRLLLKSIMEKYGFVNYDREWWHYTLKNEPFPDTYFNFPVK